MSILTRTTMLAAILCAPPALSAQEAKTLTWRGCQEAALKSNPSLAGDRALLEASRYSYYASRNQDLPYPGINASHSYSRSGSANSATTDGFSIGLNASETLFSVRSYNDLKISLKSVEQADISLRASLADTRRDLLTAFINLLYMQKKIDVMDDILAIRAKSAETINLKYESGRESNGNRMRTEAQLAQAEADLAQSKLDLLTAQRDLAANIGLDNFAAIAASGTLAVPPAVSGLNIDETALSVLSVLSARKSLELYELRVKMAGADLFPSLSASQSVNWAGKSELPGDSRSWSLGATLSWPLFGNGPTYYKNTKAAARSQQQKAQADYRAALLTAKYNLQSALANLAARTANVRVSELLLEAAKKRHEEAEIQYLAGTLNFQNWQDVEQELVSAEQSHLDALKSVNTARVQIDNLLGVPLGD